MREQLAKVSRGHDLAKAFNYILKRWASFTLFLEEGRVCLSNNAAERGLRGIALVRLAERPGCSAALIAAGGALRTCTA
jgi:transposase